MMSLSLLPAVLEILKLLLVVFVAVSGLVGFIWLNYKYWRSDYYFASLMLVAGAVFSELFLVLDFSPVAAFTLSFFPLLSGVFFRFKS